MDEYVQALEEYERTKANYEEVTEEFEQVAYLEMLSAEERVMALIRERRIQSEPL